MGRNRRRQRAAAPSSSEGEEMEVEQDAANTTTSSANNSTRAEDPEEVDTSDPVIAGLRHSMDNLLQLVKDILPTCNTEEKKAEIRNRMTDCMMKLIKTEINYLQGLKLVDKTADAMEEIDEDADDTAILAHCELLKTTALDKVTAHRNKIKNTAIKRHAYFKKLLNEMRDQNTQHGGNDEDEEEEEEDAEVADLEDDDGAELIPVTDPVSKLPLRDPVRNQYCNHVYGKASILGMLKNGNKTRCPYVGCSNKRWITEKHLQEDPELTVKVQRRVREAQRTMRTNAQQDERNTLEI